MPVCVCLCEAVIFHLFMVTLCGDEGLMNFQYYSALWSLPTVVSVQCTQYFDCSDVVDSILTIRYIVSQHYSTLTLLIVTHSVIQCLILSTLLYLLVTQYYTLFSVCRSFPYNPHTFKPPMLTLKTQCDSLLNQPHTHIHL